MNLFNKPSFFTLLSMLTLFPVLAYSQETTSEAKRYHAREIAIGIAPISTCTYGQDTMGFLCSDMLHGDSGILGGLYGETRGEVGYVPLFSISKNRYYNKFFSLKTRVSVSWLYRSIYKGVDSHFERLETQMYIHTLEMAQFNVLNKDKVKIYASVGTGLALYSFLILPTVQLVPFGITFGKKMFGFCELGIGTEYMGLHGGIGYRF